MNIEAFFKISYGLYVVSSVSNKKFNGFVSNTVFQVTSEPAQFAISCNKNNFTAQLITDSQVFSFSILHKEVKSDIIGTFGYKSGSNIEKFEKFKYRIGKTGAPILLEDSLAWFECKVVQTIDTGSHLLFIGQLVDFESLNEGDPMTYAYFREVKKGKAPKNAPTYIDADKLKQKAAEIAVEKWECSACGKEYDPSIGDPDGGIAPGTSFEDIPDDWVCPACGADKSFFVKKS